MAFQRITPAKRAMALELLSEGMTVNGICRVLKIGKVNYLRFMLETAAACEAWHDKHFRGIKVDRLSLDEQWSWIRIHKERMTPEQKRDNPTHGDSWFWISIDPKSKAIINWKTGKRRKNFARDFAGDLASRIEGRVQITTDKLETYSGALKRAFGDRLDYAQEEKIFQSVKADGPEWQKFRVNPLVGVSRTAIHGNPNLKTATVAHAERMFLTVRQSNKRTARKTLAYSKTHENHSATASVQTFIYNLCRKHMSLEGKTPAQALGIVPDRWTLEDVVKMADSHESQKANDAFETAFTSYEFKPRNDRAVRPLQPLTPWYHDKDSGGPTPPPLERKAGIRYADETSGVPVRLSELAKDSPLIF